MFKQFNLDKNLNQTRDIFDTFIYKTEDTCVEVKAAGYFDRSRFAESDSEGWANGKIECRCSDGYMEGFLNDVGDLVAELGGGASGINNFVDIGETRIQWGIINLPTDNPFPVVLPAPYRDANYIATPTFTWFSGMGAGDVGVGIAATGYTTTQFSLDSDNSISGTREVRWQTVGLKPLP